MEHPDQEEIVRIYVKGAPEYILPKCTKTFSVEGELVRFGEDQINYVLDDVVSK